jgi:hypothetical protein
MLWFDPFATGCISKLASRFTPGKPPENSRRQLY